MFYSSHVYGISQFIQLPAKFQKSHEMQCMFTQKQAPLGLMGIFPMIDMEKIATLIHGKKTKMTMIFEKQITLLSHKCSASDKMSSSSSAMRGYIKVNVFIFTKPWDLFLFQKH